jgi:hypothetical protein
VICDKAATMSYTVNYLQDISMHSYWHTIVWSFVGYTFQSLMWSLHCAADGGSCGSYNLWFNKSSWNLLECNTVPMMDKMYSAIHLSTPNIIANVRHSRLHECAVLAMRKKFKLSSDGGDSGSNKCKRGYGGAYGGVWWSLGSLESGGRFCVGAFGRNLASVAVKMFSHFIYF